MTKQSVVRAVRPEGKGGRLLALTVWHPPVPSKGRQLRVALWAMALVMTLGLAPAGGTDAVPPAAAAPGLPIQLNQAPPADPSAKDKSDAKPSDWFAAWQKAKKDLEESTGTSFALTLDNHSQFILSGRGEGHERNLFWWSLTVTQKLWPNAKLIARIRGSSNAHGQDDAPPHGIGPLISPKINLDSLWSETEFLYVANLYLEQKLLDNKLLIAVGKIKEDVYFDNNDVATADFFSYSLAKNLAIPHKSHTIGAVVRYDITDWVYVQAGVIDAQGIRSETGLDTAFHGEDYFLSLYEVGFKTKFWGKKGNWRFDLWNDSSHLSRYDRSGTESNTLGFGVSFDQMITDKIGAFFRYGVTDGDVRTFSNTWSIGGTAKGLLPGREKDVLGFGFVQGITDGSYRARYNATASESLFEVYYKIQVTDWCSICPDLQVLLNPGTRNEDVAVVAGIRVKLDF